MNKYQINYDGDRQNGRYTAVVEAATMDEAESRFVSLVPAARTLITKRLMPQEESIAYRDASLIIAKTFVII